MDLDRALEHALDGHAILFIGAGFSREARNVRNTALKNGPELTEHLSRLAGLTEHANLEDAAEEFAQQLGTDRLIKELEQEFTVSTVSDLHVEFAGVPWTRVYTTNYDNVLETAYSQVSRSLKPVVLSDSIFSITSVRLEVP